MNVEILNPFLDSFNHAVSSFFASSVKKSKVDLMDPYDPNADVYVALAVMGDINGTVFFSAKKKDALIIASKMIGTTLEQFDTLSASALQELLNITSGGAATKLSALGLETNISPPVLIDSERLKDVPLQPVLSVQLKIEEIDFCFNLSIKEKVS